MSKSSATKTSKAAKAAAKKPKARAPLAPAGLTVQDVKQGEALAAKLPGRQPPKVIESVSLMQAASMALHERKVTVGFVPTMGALHEGHLALIEHARRLADLVVVSIFVNPAQFGPSEDFDNYPRDRRGDLMKLQGAGADVAFLPTAHDMYPDGFQTTVSLGPITQGACGRYRPGHFAGVATVVLKLFNIVQPHVAVFGEKDWQQLQVIRRMTRDLNVPVDVYGMATLRDDDGLALSSRNRNLSARDREQAPVLARAVARAQAVYQSGERDVGTLCRTVIDEVKTARGVKLQYVEIVDPHSLQPLKWIDRPARILLAAHLGNVRLIDNGPLGPED